MPPKPTTPNKTRVALFIDDDLLADLDALKAEHGTPMAESVRRAIVAYVREKKEKKGGRSQGPSKARRPSKPKRKRA